ncbi:MAG TPA: universal stress protein [Terriglobales bacterium]|nr:universal stress protein [Terriglobales bacterium]
MSTAASVPAISFKHILVATDLSPASLWSLPYVTEIALQYGSTVYVGHVIPFGTYVAVRPQTFDAVEEEVRQGAQKKLDSFATELKDHGVAAKTLLHEGDVGVVMPSWIKEHDIGLVALGTTGRSGIRKLTVGSIAEEIVRDAECPVLTVGPASSARKQVAIRNILYASDFSEDSRRAGAYAMSLAGRHKARLILLHVRNEEDLKLSHASLAERLEKVIPHQATPSASTEVLIAEGRPATKVLEIAGEHSVDLIVIGVRGSGWSRVASHFGSTAHAIIVGASCPVLTVRAPNQQ